MTRTQSSLGAGLRPVRALFREEHKDDHVYWFCRLCLFAYYEVEAAPGWPVSLNGLFQLVKHVRGHTST